MIDFDAYPWNCVTLAIVYELPARATIRRIGDRFVVERFDRAGEWYTGGPILMNFHGARFLAMSNFPVRL